jgi:acyl carrier protein phosphodiesterase
MNYLAHLYLSCGSPEAITGCILGDFVKADDYKSYHPKIAQAIMLHRKIDAFTDSHPVVRRAKGRVSSHFRHTKGILTDLFFDHFLAANWSDFSTIDLFAFSQIVYQTLNDQHLVTPPRMGRMLHYMERGNWLYSYRLIQNIDQALFGLSQRLKAKNYLDQGTTELIDNYDPLKADFMTYFPLLIEFVESITGPLQGPINRPMTQS